MRCWLLVTLCLALASAQTVNLVFADLFRGYVSTASTPQTACDADFDKTVDSLLELFNTPDALSSSNTDMATLAGKYFSSNALIFDADCNSGSISNRLGVYGAQAPAGMTLNGNLMAGLAAIGANDTHTVARLMSADCRPGQKAGNIVVRWVSNQEDDIESYHFKYDSGLIDVLWYFPNMAATFEAAFNLLN